MIDERCGKKIAGSPFCGCREMVNGVQDFANDSPFLPTGLRIIITLFICYLLSCDLRGFWFCPVYAGILSNKILIGCWGWG
jgi:hypothetical protein